MLRLIGSNFRTFFLALVLGIAVWISAVTAADPDQAGLFPRAIPVEIIGLKPGLVITGNYTQQIDINLRAPQSIWEQLQADENSIRAILDLSGVSAGEHTVNIQVQISSRPVRILSVTPQAISLVLEPLLTTTLPIDLNITGQPAIGYQVGDAAIEPKEVVISGPSSQIEQVLRARVPINLSGIRESINQSLPIQLLGKENQILSGISINPEKAAVTIPVSQQGGYRDVAVKVVVTGQISNGYQLTNISVFPPVITLFSADPQLVNDLPSVIETTQLDLNNASDEINTRLELNLPPDISIVGDQTVLVKVDISPIQGSLTISNQEVNINGLPGGLILMNTPETVDVILSGPLPLLETLSTQDLIVSIDLANLEAGTHQLTPEVTVLVSDIKVEAILPTTVEIILASTTSITPTPTPMP
ncbi:MAG: hypothetical protein JXA13_04830 [Anaerolineales bacterium]|nr:hypothetical protein [Anaerolineales bacterium]